MVVVNIDKKDFVATLELGVKLKKKKIKSQGINQSEEESATVVDSSTPTSLDSFDYSIYEEVDPDDGYVITDEPVQPKQSLIVGELFKEGVSFEDDDDEGFDFDSMNDEDDDDFNMDDEDDENDDFDMDGNDEDDFDMDNEDDEDDFNIDGDDEDEDDFDMDGDDEDEDDFDMDGDDEDEDDDFNMDDEDEDDDDFIMDDEDEDDDDIDTEEGNLKDTVLNQQKKNKVEESKKVEKTVYAPLPEVTQHVQKSSTVQNNSQPQVKEEVREESNNTIETKNLNVNFYKGMKLDEFLRENPTIRAEKDVLEYFHKDECNAFIRHGKVQYNSKKRRFFI